MHEGVRQNRFIERLKSKFKIDAKNIGYFVYPLAQFIYNQKPNYIIALDSGARLTGFALMQLYHRLYGELPTFDHAISYRRISHRVDEEKVRAQITADAQRMLQSTENPSVLIVDDWVNKGTTQEDVKRIFREVSGGRIQVTFGVMRELGLRSADITADRFSIARTAWHHDAKKIGVKYEDASIKATAVRGGEALMTRRKIKEGIDQFIDILKQQRSKTSQASSKQL